MKSDMPGNVDLRTKVVSFRVSDSEYEIASEFCKNGGFRGMSMLARSAFLAYVPQAAGEAEHPKAEVLQSELKVLHSELARLINSLSRISGGIPSEPSPSEINLQTEETA